MQKWQSGEKRLSVEVPYQKKRSAGRNGTTESSITREEVFIRIAERGEEAVAEVA